MPDQSDQPLLWIAPQAASFLHVSLNTLYILCRAGEIPHFRLGTKLRFDPDDLRSWLEANRRGPKASEAS